LSTYETFVLSAAPGDANADIFWTFDWDAIELDASVMPALGPSGTLSYYDPRCTRGGATGGHDADDRIIYDKSTVPLLRRRTAAAPARRSSWPRCPSRWAGGASINEIRIVNGGTGGLAIDGTSGDDSLDGTRGADTMHGFAGERLAQR
jgi:hypothetical protein